VTSPARRTLSLLALATASTVSMAVLAACSGQATGASSPSIEGSSSTSPGSATATSSASAPSSPSSSATASCVDTTYAALSPEQRAGQLVMVALQAGSSSASLKPTIEGQHVGNMLYLGGWKTGKADITATSALLQKMATQEATGGIGLLVAADQEGGNILQLRGDFTAFPSAATQGTWPAERLRSSAQAWGTELKSAGVNLDLAPVADTVPAELGRANQPIGRWDRQFGSTPEAVSAGVTSFVEGMTAAGVQTSVKHFPGIGRITGNTDFVASDVNDAVMTADDPYLQTFVAGWKAGAGLVMVSSATYSQLDPSNQAMFSPVIIDSLLREKLGFTGVVITDDINAAAVKPVPVADRATRFISAGGDILLTGDTASGPTLVSALTSAAAGDPAFAAKVETSVKRVLTLKASMGLVPGCTG
jgi:beta-N-acetylhexosaminidase